MNKRFLSVFVFAVIFSGLASLVLYRLLVSRLSSSHPQAGAAVIVAALDLELGTLIREGDLAVETWAGPVPAHAVTKKEDIVGRGVTAEIYRGEPIVESRLAPVGGGAGLAALIPKGMRAVAVRVNDVVGVAGFVVPGSRVDVLMSGLPPGSSNLGTQTKTILQDIQVLFAGQNIQKDAEGKPVQVQVVNLLATPEQAEVLSLAGNDTRIQLVLRNPLDAGQAKPPGTALARLFNGNAAPERPKAKPAPVKVDRPALPAVKEPVRPPVVVEVLTGTKRVEATFHAPQEVRQ